MHIRSARPNVAAIFKPRKNGGFINMLDSGEKNCLARENEPNFLAEDLSMDSIYSFHFKSAERSNLVTILDVSISHVNTQVFSFLNLINIKIVQTSVDSERFQLNYYFSSKNWVTAL